MQNKIDFLSFKKKLIFYQQNIAIQILVLLKKYIKNIHLKFIY